MLKILGLLAALCVAWLSAEAVKAATVFYGGIAFVSPSYDYAPVVMNDGGLTKIWWCGEHPVIAGDAIGYRTHNGVSWSNAVVALGRTPGSWDDLHTCDPSVVKGSFSYGGGTYSYAMYYTGAGLAYINYGRIGVAFSNDGINWIKRPNPIIYPVGGYDQTYGAGMPSFHRQQGTAASGWLIWYDSTWPGGPAAVYAYTTDGINFGAPMLFATEAAHGIVGDVAWNAADQHWYVTTMTSPAQVRVDVYSSPDPVTSPWTLVGSLGQGETGGLRNHNPGFMREPNGNLTIGPGGVKYFVFGTGGGSPGSWDIGFGYWY